MARRQERSGIQRQRGFTLMEIIVGSLIFVFFLTVVGALVLANRSQVTGAADLAFLQNARSRVQQCASNYGASYAWVTTAQALICGAVPSQRVRGTQALNSFNGSVTFSAGSGGNTFVITTTQVPGPDACLSEASVMYGTWTTVQVNGTSIPQTDQAGAIAAAATACLKGSNTLTFESS